MSGALDRCAAAVAMSSASPAEKKLANFANFDMLANICRPFGASADAGDRIWASKSSLPDVRPLQGRRFALP